MITLVIVGVVAAITVPAVMNNINTKQKDEKIKNVNHKLAKSADKMLGISGMNGYLSTEEFLKAFKNHLSIAKICTPENIQDCWGSKTIILKNGKPYDVTKIKSPSELRISKTKNSGYQDIMGFVMNDGTPFIISYDTSCDMSSSQQGIVWTKGGQSSSTNCISGIYDYNGGKKPNKYGDDVLSLNASAGLGRSCAVEVNDNCYSAAQVVSPLTKQECESIKSDYGIKGCAYENDYWAGAVKLCGGVNNLITKEELKKIAEEIYGMPINDMRTTTCSGGKNCFNAEAAQKYQISPGTWYWSAEEYNAETSWLRIFSSNGTDYSGARGHGGPDRNGGGGLVLCSAN